jgi:hypothetical protein
MFQRAVWITALLSLLLAIMLSWALNQSVNWAWVVKTTGSDVSGKPLNTGQKALIEEMYVHIQSTQQLQEEQGQRLVVLRVIHELAHDPLLGVWIKKLHWVEGMLEVDAWVSSKEQAQDWVARLQGIQGVVGIEKVTGTPDPLASELSMQVLQLKLKIGGGDVQP